MINRSLNKQILLLEITLSGAMAGIFLFGKVVCFPASYFGSKLSSLS